MTVFPRALNPTIIEKMRGKEGALIREVVYSGNETRIKRHASAFNTLMVEQNVIIHSLGK